MRIRCSIFDFGIDQAQPEGTRLFVRGWVVDPSTGDPLQVEVTANAAVVASGLADRSRPDVQNAVDGAGPNQGYQFYIDSLANGEYNLEVYAYDSLGARVLVNRLVVKPPVDRHGDSIPVGDEDFFVAQRKLEESATQTTYDDPEELDDETR